MKKTLCFALALILCLSACGRPAAPAQTSEPTPAPTAELTQEPTPTAVPTAEPTAEPAPAETPEPDEALDRALAFLRAQDVDYVQKHIQTYLELYRITHPGANVEVIGWTSNPRRITLDLTGLDAEAFAEAGYLPEQAQVGSTGVKNEFAALDEPIPREPEWDRVSERGMRFVMDRAVWPRGTEYVSFTFSNESEEDLMYGASFDLQKYVDGEWRNVQWAGMVLAIGYILRPGASRSQILSLVHFPALGEGLYRVGFLNHGDWAEFALREEAEPLDLSRVWRMSWPEAALLLAGLPENVESELETTHWPAVSHVWQLREDRSLTDDELVSLLLGEGAVYDPAGKVWRSGERTLRLEEGARLESDTDLARALRLVLPQADRDPRSIPSLEAAGWQPVLLVPELPLLQTLYPRLEASAYAVYAPDVDVLNARLEAVLETLGAEAGIPGDFRFTPEDGEGLRLTVVPVCIDELGRASLRSPYGELEGAAAWFFSDEGGLLDFTARLPGYALEPLEEHETVSPLVQAEKFLPLLEGEEGLRLTALEYALIPEYWKGVLLPVWRLRGETAEGEERTWAVSAVSKGASAYDLKLRTFLNRLQREIWDLFRAYREKHPEADVWCNSGGIQRDETGKEYLEVLCYGADIPELEASGFLPEEAVLNCPEISFFQKEAHPCPREPEWEKDWGTVTLTMSQGEYPLYPEQVELTMRCEKRIQRDWFSFKKYVDGEWLTVPRILSGTLEFKYVEAGETVFQVPTLSKLGPGLYRLYLSERFWVEFKVTDS